jgi:hypothetical protein
LFEFIHGLAYAQMKQIHKENKVAKEEATKIIKQLEQVMAVKIPTIPRS